MKLIKKNLFMLGIVFNILVLTLINYSCQTRYNSNSSSIYSYTSNIQNSTISTTVYFTSFTMNKNYDTKFDDISNDEYLVYSVVMEDRFPDVDEYVIYKFTINENEEVIKRYKDNKNDKLFDNILINNYLKKNRTSIEIKNKFTIKKNTLLIDWTWKNDPHQTKFYEFVNPITKKHNPDKPTTSWLIKLSRVGFNSEGNKAFLTYIEWLSGKAASGISYLLEKKDNKWVIIKKFEMWVS